MNAPDEPRPPISRLAITAIVCVVLCVPLAGVFAVLALLRIAKSQGRLRGRRLAITALILSIIGVPLLGVQAAVVVPSFLRYQCKSKQAEAKTNLKRIFVSQEAFRAKEKRYGTLEEVGFAPRGKTLRYRYELVDIAATHFMVRAVGRSGEMAGDEWSIAQDNQLLAVTSICGR